MKEILITKHAWEKMAERGISSNEIEEAIKSGQKAYDGKRKLWHFRHKYYEVVCEINDIITVVTVYLVV